MRVLVACECFGRVRDAFIARGHDSWSCDLYPTRVPGPHIQGDVLKILGDGWDLMVAHPPCTHLSISGARHFKNIQKRLDQLEAIRFFEAIYNAPIEKIAIENPVGIMSTRLRPPDQIIQPYEFGEREKKTTCLWLKGLPLLVPSKVVDPNLRRQKSGAVFTKGYDKRIPEIKNRDLARSVARSITFQGIANAMAAQWG